VLEGAVEMVGWRQGLVRAEEVDTKVRLVMETRELQDRVSVYRNGVAITILTYRKLTNLWRYIDRVLLEIYLFCMAQNIKYFPPEFYPTFRIICICGI
jgi:hypothetical protein